MNIKLKHIFKGRPTSMRLILLTEVLAILILLTCLYSCIILPRTNPLQQVREKIAACRAVLSIKELPPHGCYRNLKVPENKKALFLNLGLWASNHMDFICQNFNRISTNTLDRAILLYAESSLSDECYLTFLDRNIDLAANGQLTGAELLDYQFLQRDYRRLHLIALWYDRPGVSNIISKLLHFFYRTNYYSRILSGERKPLVERFLDATPAALPPLKPPIDPVQGLALEKAAWQELSSSLPSRDLEGLADSFDFVDYFRCAEHDKYARAISNNWRSVLAALPQIGTNRLERYAILGVGKTFGDDFYIDYCMALADLHHEKIISDDDLDWMLISRQWVLMDCFRKRQEEPLVRDLLKKLIIELPKHSDILTDFLLGIDYIDDMELIDNHWY